MSSKKGFVVSQAMIYAFAMLVVALIFFWGYKSMSTFSSASQQSELNSFRLNFLSDMETLSFKKDTIREFNYNLPIEYDKFCVFDLEQISNVNATVMTYYPILKEGVQDKVNNVFVLGKNKIFAFKSDFIIINKYPYYYCSSIFNGNLKFSAKGSTYKSIISNDSEITSQIIMNNIAKTKLTGINANLDVITSGSDQYTFTADYTLYATDGFAYIKIPKDTVVTLPLGSKPELFLEIIYPDINSDSENYVANPKGTTFSNNIVFAKRPKSGDCYPGNDYIKEDDPDAIFVGCENGFVKFNIIKFID